MLKIRRFTLASHSLIWLLLLVIPYISTDQVFRSLAPASDMQYLMLCLALSAVLLGTFYVNYLLLIPRFLLSRRYSWYAILLVLDIALVLILSGSIFFFSDFNPMAPEGLNPIIEKVIPVIIINAVALWLLAIISSILWTVYDALKQTEREKLSAQLASLKSQINPHFLFNTLNNIYATTIDAAPRAADMVDKLSEMMRYTMQDTRHDSVPLEDELNYISNYIELQRLRLDRSVQLEYIIPHLIPEVRIAPMLLIPFIENAFKHGVNSEQKSRISIEISITNAAFQLNVVNTKVNVQRETSERSGLGIGNTKHRLRLTYPSKHLLVISDIEKTFSVSLHIDLK